MKRAASIIPVAILLAVLVMPLLMMGGSFGPPVTMTSDSTMLPEGTTLQQIDDWNEIDVGPNEQLYKYDLSDQSWTQWIDVSSELLGGEFGNRSDSFPDRQMTYETSQTTTNETVSIPTGTDWEAYSVRADITDLTENRTWVQNPDFTNNANGWTLDHTPNAGNSWTYSQWLDEGHGTGDDSLRFEVDSQSPGDTYWYDAGDQAWATQTMSVPRGTVVWAGLRLDFWADTTDDTHYGMTGSFAIYVTVEGNRAWYMVFDAIDAEETWYDSGLIPVKTEFFGLPSDTDITLTVGLESTQPVGYEPEIGPVARVDNVELYVKTLAAPSDVNLEMNGNAVTDGASDGIGYIIEMPTMPWQTDPVQLNFTWTPTPATPSPNRQIRVDFDITTNMFARRLGARTVSEINPTAYGERFEVSNGTDVVYTTYFYSDIPEGYVNYYFYNISLPLNRDVTFVGRPLAPSTNLTSGLSGGDIGDGFLNVSTFDVATEAGRYGYWRIKSTSANMITDLEVYDPNDTTWKRYTELRAGNSTQIRVYVGSSYQDSIVNITIYDPDGNKWHSENAVADAGGWATSTSVSFPGATTGAGSWTVQATTNDFGTNGAWRSTGFFKREFDVTHTSELIIDYPTDAVGTWTTNVTYGDLLLIVMRANDTDSNVLVPGGTLALDWVLGTDTFDDSGNGQYTKVIDTSLLTSKGQYTMNLDWTADNYDTALATLTINVLYATTLTSPEYPGISGAIGYDQTFTVDFANVNGTGILGGSLICDWAGGYSVTPLGSGSYEFTLNGGSTPIGRYPVVINATAPFVNSASMVLYVDVREIYNSVSYSANELSIPLGEERSFELTWINTETDTPITDGIPYITCNWTSFHSFGEINYTINHLGSGVYNITIHTEDDDPLTAIDEYYTVRFSVMRHNHQNHTFDIRVRIRSHNTLFILDEPVEQTPIGGTITVLAFFQDTDLQVGITNITGNVQIQVSSPEIGAMQISVAASSFGDGHYNISIPAGQWGSIGWKNLTIDVIWIGAEPKYIDQQINTRVRILGTETDLYLGNAPTATYYLDTFTFTVIYYDIINGTNISNNSLGYFVVLGITPLTGGHSVTQADFAVGETGAGTGIYEFILDTSAFQATGTFQFQLDFSWTKGETPFYENQTMTVSLVVLNRPTYVDYIPVQATPFNETAEFTFSYIDSLTTNRIADGSELTISLQNVTVDFTYSFNAGDTSFTLYIDTTTLPGISTYLLVLELNWMGEPFYPASYTQAFSVTVVQRTTQLTHLSFAPGQWGNNVTIEFVYTDLVAGETTGMTGTLTLNASLAGWYDVSYLGNGHYLVLLNTSGFGTDGLYTLTATIAHSLSTFADAAESFGFSVLMRATQFGYDTPDAAPYLENVAFTVTYVDDSTGRGISAADITVDCSNSTYTLVLGSNYTVTYLGSGQYLIEVNTTALGSLGAFVLNVSASYTGAPYYLPASRNVNSRVIARTTQILITQTPGETAFFENVTFRFKFEDYLTGIMIAIAKSHISLSHGVGQTTIPSSDYTLYDYGTFYEISFNSTVLNAAGLVVGEEIQLEIDRTAGEPYYGLRSTTTVATTIERPTQILFPLIEEVPYFDNFTIELDYIDFISGLGIENAAIVITSTNWSVAQYQVVDLGSGAYSIYINSTLFGGVGTVYFDISVGRVGVPFYASRFAASVPASIRPVITTLVAEAPPPGSTAVGVPIVVTLTLMDFDHDVPLEGAAITTDWTSLYGTGYSLVPEGNGVYTLTLDMTGLLAQDYPFMVLAQKTFYQDASLLVSVTPGASTFSIVLERTTVYSLWGEIQDIRLDIRESYYYSLVPGANVSLIWEGNQYNFTDLNNGTYSLLLDTSIEDFGIYELLVSVSREYYQTRQTTTTLVVSKAPGQILAEQTVFDVVINTVLPFTIYLNDTVTGQPVVATSVTMEWNNTAVPLFTNGTLGFYLASIDSTGFEIGSYELILTAAAMNHVFLESVVDVNIVPIPTRIGLTSGAAALFVIRGDTLSILVEYNDTYYGGYVAGANVSYTLGSLTGQLTAEPNGTYSVEIDTSDLPAQIIYLRITGSKVGMATSTRTLVVTIQSVPTTLSADTLLQEGYHGQVVEFRVYYNDTHNFQPIVGAFVDVAWEGGPVTVTDLGTGYYLIQVALTPASPRLYDVTMSFNLQNYTLASLTVRVVILATPASIEGPSEFDVAINDNATIYFNVIDTVADDYVGGLNGVAYWQTGLAVPLRALENGSYALDIPDYLSIGQYRIEIGFSTSIYSLTTHILNLEVRRVDTELSTGDQRIVTQPGGQIEIVIIYRDLDHDNVPIEDANYTIVYPVGNITYNEARMTALDGVYTFPFTVNTGGTMTITITFTKDLYETKTFEFVIVSDFSEAQILAQNLAVAGGFIFIFIAIGIVAYVKHFAIPWIIRVLNKMIAALAGGKIPSPAKVRNREEMILEIVNEELEPVGLQKFPADVPGPSIEAIVPEIEDLLERLAAITGLGEIELEAFRQDLARMKASERPGFIQEVIDQEEARRAETLAEAEPIPDEARVILEEKPEELEELRIKLKRKGMADDEIEIIIEQAKSLSKADLEALLDSLGIKL